jgi:hypothetical protein
MAKPCLNDLVFRGNETKPLHNVVADHKLQTTASTIHQVLQQHRGNKESKHDMTQVKAAETTIVVWRLATSLRTTYS